MAVGGSAAHAFRLQTSLLAPTHQPVRGSMSRLSCGFSAATRASKPPVRLDWSHPRSRGTADAPSSHRRPHSPPGPCGSCAPATRAARRAYRWPSASRGSRAPPAGPLPWAAPAGRPCSPCPACSGRADDKALVRTRKTNLYAFHGQVTAKVTAALGTLEGVCVPVAHVLLAVEFPGSGGGLPRSTGSTASHL